nr:MAG TPA: Head fiber protein [Caudoviricetes sp.]
MIPASAVYVPQPGGAAKPLDTVLSGMPAKQAAAVRDATTGQEAATINALLTSLRNAGIIAK